MLEFNLSDLQRNIKRTWTFDNFLEKLRCCSNQSTLWSCGAGQSTHSELDPWDHESEILNFSGFDNLKAKFQNISQASTDFSEWGGLGSQEWCSLLLLRFKPWDVHGASGRVRLSPHLPHLVSDLNTRDIKSRRYKSSYWSVVFIKASYWSIDRMIPDHLVLSDSLLSILFWPK